MDTNESSSVTSADDNTTATSTAATSNELEQALLTSLMEAWKIYQDTNRHPHRNVRVDESRDRDDCTHQRLLAEAYRNYVLLSDKDMMDEEDETKENQQLSVAPADAASSSSSSSSSVVAPVPAGDSVAAAASSSLSGATITDAQVGPLVEKALKFCHQKQRQLYAAGKTSAAHQQTSSESPPSGQQQQPAAETAPPSGIIKRPLGAPSPVKTPTIAVTPHPVSPNLLNYTNKLQAPSQTAATVDKKTAEVVLSEGMGGGKVAMVTKGGQTYTKIETKIPAPKRHIGFVHLQIPGQDHDSRTELRRSSSVPLADQSSLNRKHRALYRTGSSVSDSTKLILRSTIQEGRSAALIRKPSITDHEIDQIGEDENDDDDDDDDDDEDMEGWSEEDEDDCDVAATSSAAAGPSSSKKMKLGDVAQDSASTAQMVAPLSPPLHVTMTTAAT